MWRRVCGERGGDGKKRRRERERGRREGGGGREGGREGELEEGEKKRGMFVHIPRHVCQVSSENFVREGACARAILVSLFAHRVDEEGRYDWVVGSATNFRQGPVALFYV